MTLGRLRAPKQNQAILADPPLAQWQQLLADNRAWLSQNGKHTFFGDTLTSWRTLARSQSMAAARRFLTELGDKPSDFAVDSPLIVTGHQPEAFHTGVWIKNFGIAKLGALSGGVGCNFLADHDMVKSAAIRLPAGTVEHPLEAHVAIDRLAGEIPFEEWNVADSAIFDAFGARARETISQIVDRPILESFWPAVEKCAARTKNVGQRLGFARHSVESQFGIRNLELPLSQLCDGAAFTHFVAGMVLDAPAFAESHNRELAKFRKARRIRSVHHPFPKLKISDGQFETPFWVWSAEHPRRQPLIVESNRGSLKFFAGREAIFETNATASIPKLGEQLRTLRGPWRIRPRALTTTMFLRLFVADLFVHGIGGGKYDELTDAIVADYFRMPPPKFAILTASCLVAGDVDFQAAGQLRSAARKQRDLNWNPDRYLDGGLSEQSPIADWIERKFELIGADPTRGDRKRFEEFRRLNERLREFVEPAANRAELAIQEAKDNLRREQLLTSREYPFFVHSSENIAKLIEKLDRQFTDR